MDLDPWKVQELEDTAEEESLSKAKMHKSTEQVCPWECITSACINTDI